jgi:hypothetical protein
VHGQKGPNWTITEKRRNIMKAILVFIAAVAGSAASSAVYAGLSVQMTCALLTGSCAFYIWARRLATRTEAVRPDAVRQLTASVATEANVAAPPEAYWWTEAEFDDGYEAGISASDMSMTEQEAPEGVTCSFKAGFDSGVWDFNTTCSKYYDRSNPKSPYFDRKKYGED